MNYKYVAESDTQLLGNGISGDRIYRIVVIPSATISVGDVSIKDGTDTAIVIYSDASSSRPMTIELDIQSGSGWSIITGANVTALIIGEW